MPGTLRKRCVSAYVRSGGRVLEMLLRLCLYIFFFSSRRRHTRLQGDWSSDVCSSDLEREARMPRDKRTELSTSVAAGAEDPHGDGIHAIMHNHASPRGQ